MRGTGGSGEANHGQRRHRNRKGGQIGDQDQPEVGERQEHAGAHRGALARRQVVEGRVQRRGDGCPTTDEHTLAEHGASFIEANERELSDSVQLRQGITQSL